jgi:flavin reductase (DIM6/NTAB) family NADH-FMN oxidoreductase RutF|tara:strand:+ start:705 stop:1109 length:405 start_codon:yes stop_codon:yes gene_type:complete
MSNKDNADNPNAITVSSVTSISMDPPSLLICINKSSRIHNSIELESKFCINLLNNKQEDLSNICSDEDMYDQRFKDENWNLDGIPFLKNAQANIFCKVDKLTSYHTHTIVIGLVEDANYADEISTLTYVDGEYK